MLRNKNIYFTGNNNRELANDNAKLSLYPRRTKNLDLKAAYTT